MFTRIEVPTPFAVGPVAAYLAGRTLVDPGPDSEAARAALRDGLADHGLAPTDVERVLITHPHPDHFGAARRLRDDGADVLASPAAASLLSAFESRLGYEQSYFAGFFERCGMDRETAETVTQLPAAFLPYVDDVAVDRELTDGDEVVVDDAAVTVDSLAGHAVGELRFTYAVDAADGSAVDADAEPWAERGPTDHPRRVSLVGDHVLPDHSPTPFLQPPPESGGRRPRVLPAYNESLDELRSADLDRLLPGHGDPIRSPAERIDALRREHDRRTERVAGILDGPTTPHAVMRNLFSDLPATEQFGGMSEAVGHLDVLVARGRARCRERDERIVYEGVDE